jgi:hypothetical protein
VTGITLAAVAGFLPEREPETFLEPGFAVAASGGFAPGFGLAGAGGVMADFCEYLPLTSAASAIGTAMVLAMATATMKTPR